MSNRTELPETATTADAPPSPPDHSGGASPPAFHLPRQAEPGPRNRNGTFAKGTSGNPSGMAPGTRQHVNRLLDEIATGDVAEVLTKAIERAKKGDVAAARLILRRAWSVPKGRPVEGLDLPPVNSPADALAAMGAITAALAAGTISTDEARDLSEIFDAYRKMHEVVDLDRRISRLERQQRHDQKF